ncbi:MAG: hypothetical protein ACEPOW_11570, partial [Bacteroidales bacterium]
MKKVLILLIALIYFPVWGQENKWIKYYKPKKLVDIIYSSRINEHYDNGFVISGWYGSSGTSSFIKKLDINGNELWTKEIKEIASYISFCDHDVDSKGAIYAGGCTSYLKNGNDACLIKFNACGEIEWGKILSTNSKVDYISDVFITQEGNCLVSINYRRGNGLDPISFFCFSSDGELLWRQYCEIQDQDLIGECIRHFIQLPGGDLFISGSVYKKAPSDEEVGLLKALAMLCDSKGNVKWVKVPDWENVEEGYYFHKGLCGKASLNQKNLYQGLYFGDEENKSRAGLVKWDRKGNLLGRYFMREKPKNGQLNYIEFVEENTIIASYGFVPFETEKRVSLNKSLSSRTLYKDLWNQKNINTEKANHSYAVLLDTLGNIKKKIPRNNYYSAKICRTHNNKYLFYGQFKDEKEKINIVIEKYNSNLEFDSIYTQKRKYDYLCDHPIKYEMFDLSHFMVVGLEDTPQQKELRSLNIFPNPFQDRISIQLPEYI